MGIWNFYFISKLFLYFSNYIDFHVLLNLAFAALLSIPIPYRRVRLLRNVLAVPTGIALFYYDTWFPPFSRVIAEYSNLEGFSLAYIMELSGRFFSIQVIIALAILYAVYSVARTKLRITTFVFVAMLVPLLPVSSNPTSASAGVGNKAASTEVDGVPLQLVEPNVLSAENASGTPTDFQLTSALNSFYRREAARIVSFSPAESTDDPFDIIFLQICSLSWDDLNFYNEQNNPLFRHFDIVFTNFYTASSYSGPAAIRLLRGSCGQPKHSRLYDPSPPKCQTINELEQIGFKPQLAMNHDGQYGGFIENVSNLGELKVPPFDISAVPAYLQSFDGSSVRDDYSVLTKWWEERVKKPAKRVVLFYNTISLHDGNRYSGNRSANSMETYHQRQARLLSDIDRFFSDLQASGRRAVVVFIPEHGASIRGDKMQVAGMREIPSPRISNVPVGIKLIGIAENPMEKPLIVPAPISYLAVSQLLSDFIRATPFGKNSPSLEKFVSNLPSTDFVAENEDVVVMGYDKRYFIHTKDAEWVEYDPD
jgi:cellulose synthase operon protein YhjU